MPILNSSARCVIARFFLPSIICFALAVAHCCSASALPQQLPIHILYVNHVEVESVLDGTCMQYQGVVCSSTAERYDLTGALLEYEMSQAESVGGTVSFHMSGAYAERALAAGDQFEWLDNIDRGHTVGVHAHSFVRGPEPFQWIRNESPTQPDIEQHWQDNHDLVAALVGTDRLWIGESHYPCPTCWERLGYSVKSTEHMSLLPEGQHIVWLVERDASGIIVYPHFPQIGKAGVHGPEGSQSFFDLRIPQLKKEFIMLYLEWLERERLGLESQVWAWGWVNHGGNSTEQHKTDIEEMLQWLAAHFVGKTSSRGNNIARFVNDHQIADIYETFEQTGGQALPSPASHVNDRFPYMAHVLTGAGITRELTNDLDYQGVRLFELEKVPHAPSASAETERFYLLFRETDGSGAVDLSTVLEFNGVKTDMLKSLDVVDGSTNTIDPADITLGYTPMVLEITAGSGTAESPFGFHPARVSMPGYSDNGFTDAENIGVGWAREGIYALWFLVEPDLSKTEYDFELHDRQWRDVPSSLHILANIAPQGPIDEGRCKPGSWIPTDTARYTAFVKATVERYDGDGVDDMPELTNPIRYWQVGNEPSELGRKDFAQLQRITYDAIKEACADCKVLIGGVAGFPYDYIHNFNNGFAPILSELAGRSVDIFDFHWYGTATGEYRMKDALTGQDVPEHIRSTLAATGFPSDLPIWITEMGCYSGDPADTGLHSFPPQTEREQALDLFKRYIYPLANGVEKVFSAFGLVEGFKLDNGYFDHTGLIYDGRLSDPASDPDPGLGVRKLAYYTYKKMTEKLSSADWSTLTLLHNGTETDRLNLFRIHKGDKVLHIAWWDYFDEPASMSGDTRALTITGLDSPAVTVTAMTPSADSGQEVSDYDTAFATNVYPVSNGAAAIMLGQDPVVVEPISGNVSVDIRANGQDGPLTVSSEDAVTLTLTVDADGYQGLTADWWLAATTPSGWYFYVHPSGWQTEIEPCLQMAPCSLPPTNLPPITPPAGETTFYFAVDHNADGKPDGTWADSVQVQSN